MVAAARKPGISPTLLSLLETGKYKDKLPGLSWVKKMAKLYETRI